MLKNQYEMGSPEWLLMEQIISNHLNSLTAAREAEQLTKRSADHRAKSEIYQEALRKLDPQFAGMGQA